MRRRSILAIAAVVATIAAGGVVAVTVFGTRASESVQAAPALAVLGSDGFDRSIDLAWGVPDSGGPYTFVGEWSMSVGDGTGKAVVGPGDGGAAMLTGVDAADVVVSATIADTSGAPGVVLIARAQSGQAYRAVFTALGTDHTHVDVARVGPSGGAIPLGSAEMDAADPGSTTAPSLEFRVSGQKPVLLEARVVQKRSPAWEKIATDDTADRLWTAGAVGVGLTTTDAATAGVAWDSISATAVDEDEQPAVLTAGTDRGRTVEAGSRDPGDASYAVPAGALFVATDGDDTAGGSLENPFRTIGAAIAAAKPGGTIVVRAGDYHESVDVEHGDRLTLQSYPGEAVWLDGSEAVDGWTPVAAGWAVSGWKPLDSSPTYTRGAPDYTQKNWAFVDPAHPAAAYPEQVWVDGEPLTQVLSRTALAVGSFYVDPVARQLVIGTDPTGHVITASTLQRAITIDASGTIVRGIGVRRYAPSVPDIGALRIERTAQGTWLENVVVTENSTTGLSVTAPGVVLNGVTASANGMLGMHALYADGLRATSISMTGNNTEGFNQVPAAAGAKLTRTRDVIVRDSSFDGNDANGLWFDESCFDIRVVGSTLSKNGRNGLLVELSAQAELVDLYAKGNVGVGVKIFNTSDVGLWNSSLTDNGVNLHIAQDTRVASDPDAAGHDPRQAVPDPAMTWIVDHVVISNVVIARSHPDGDSSVRVADVAQLGVGAGDSVQLLSSIFQRDDSSAPRVLIAWPDGQGGLVNYTSLEAFEAGTGQKDAGQELSGTSSLPSSGTLSATRVVGIDVTPTTLPADVAALAPWLADGPVGASHQ